MRTMAKKYLLFVFVFIFTVFGSFVSAQIRNTDIVLSVSPQYPNSNQNVNITLNSYAINLDKANISWSVNGQETSRGIGKKSFSIKTGEVGLSVVLSAIIETIDGQSLSKTITITPADVSMLWEASDSYTPPFYKGKALAPSQGKFKIVAIPNLVNQIGKININNLSYTWIKDGNVQLNSSGWGKNYFTFQNSYLDKENNIEVKISDISGSINTSGKITLRTTDPKILFYRNDPQLGVRWETALDNRYTINPSGEILIVEPYFFSPKNINSSALTFDWFLGGEKIQTPNPKNILPIKPEAGKSGSAIIKVLISNTKTLFQNMSNQIKVSF